jgi:hypothetical protein
MTLSKLLHELVVFAAVWLDFLPGHQALLATWGCMELECGVPKATDHWSFMPCIAAASEEPPGNRFDPHHKESTCEMTDSNCLTRTATDKVVRTCILPIYSILCSIQTNRASYRATKAARRCGDAQAAGKHAAA